MPFVFGKYIFRMPFKNLSIYKYLNFIFESLNDTFHVSQPYKEAPLKVGVKNFKYKIFENI